jgi:preprotein translocase subunit SecF
MLVVSLAGNEAITSQEQETITDTLITLYPDSDMKISSSLIVEPFIGKRFFTNGMIAIGLAFFLIFAVCRLQIQEISAVFGRIYGNRRTYSRLPCRLRRRSFCPDTAE